MKKLILFLLFFTHIQFIYAQDTVIKKIISITGGTIANFPSIDNYSINNTYEYDGYEPKALSQYDAVVSSEVTLGLFLTGSYKKCLVNYNHTNLFLSANLSYKKTCYSISYRSNEMYYDSTRIWGNGTAKWKEHYLAPALGLTLLSQIGKKIYIENNLNIRKAFLIKSREEIMFNGEEAKGFDNRENYERTLKKYYSAEDYPIKTNLLDIFYEIGFGYKVNKSIMILSEITIPIINFHKKEISNPFSEIGSYNEPRFVRENYNEIFLGIKLNYLLK